jgi:thiol-disulfide isomerase/thioredoxin
MAKTESTMLPLGTKAPDFRLPNANPAWGGQAVALSELDTRRGALVMFICNHCPYVKHLAAAIQLLAQQAQESGLAVVAIQPNDYARYPDDAPAKVAEECALRGYAFPYAIDESQDVAKAYRAACTPDFFLFGPTLELVYRGQFDDSRPGNGKPVTGHDLQQAIDAVLANREVPQPQRPSIGCNIKWKPGNEPDYFG